MSGSQRAECPVAMACRCSPERANLLRQSDKTEQLERVKSLSGTSTAKLPLSGTRRFQIILRESFVQPNDTQTNGSVLRKLSSND